MIEKVRFGISNPQHATRHIGTRLRIVRQMIADGRPKEAMLYLPATVGKDDFFWEYIDDQAGGEKHLVRDIDGHEMVVDLEDEGLSKELLQTGTHEPTSTAYFERELSRLRETVTPVTVLEVGGNIGYYTLIEADTLGSDGSILVCEPSPENVSILQENVSRNGYDDVVDVSQLGLSDETGTAEFFLSSHSNCHSFESDSRFRDTTESIEVDVMTVDDFLAERGIAPETIHVVRMDVEGHEAKILEGMDELLAADGPMLLYVEFHSELIDNGELEDTLAKITDAGFELAFACNDNMARGADNVCETVEEIPENIRYDNYENLQTFFRKGY